MPNQARNGYSFEYSIIQSLPLQINDWIESHHGGSCHYRIVEDAAFENVKRNFESTDPILQTSMVFAARAGIKKILEMEPRLTHATTDDPIEIYAKPSSSGITGDVRDVVMIRQIANSKRRVVQNILQDQSNHWEIGISAKWNNDVIKNSRLAENLDFCQSWFGFSCSDRYWEEIKIPMEYIRKYLGTPWNRLPSKVELVYLPMITAFINEMTYQSIKNPNLSELLVNYLVGKYDFYKLIARKNHRITDIQAFNLRGNLNQDCNGILPIIRIPSQSNQKPTRIVSIGKYHNRPSWVEIILDNGWQFTLRLHNAETNIIPSLKFDIRFAGNPVNTWSEQW